MGFKTGEEVLKEERMRAWIRAEVVEMERRGWTWEIFRRHKVQDLRLAVCVESGGRKSCWLCDYNRASSSKCNQDCGNLGGKNWVWEMRIEVVPMETHSRDLGTHLILEAPLWVLDSFFQMRLGLKWLRNLPKVTLRKCWRCNSNPGISANHNANYLHQGNSGGINMIPFEPAEIWGTWGTAR